MVFFIITCLFIKSLSDWNFNFCEGSAVFMRSVLICDRKDHPPFVGIMYLAHSEDKIRVILPVNVNVSLQYKILRLYYDQPVKCKVFGSLQFWLVQRWNSVSRDWLKSGEVVALFIWVTSVIIISIKVKSLYWGIDTTHVTRISLANLKNFSFVNLHLPDLMLIQNYIKYSKPNWTETNLN